MTDLSYLFQYNQTWAKNIINADPDFFQELSKIQTPRYLWIGCSDSRVPANQITGLQPGELFVHRNVANLVVHTDLNCLSVIQYAIDVLRVTDILVVGHYGCGGIKSALQAKPLGLIDNWLRHVQDVSHRHEILQDPHMDVDLRTDLLCELNVIDQVRNIARTTIVGHAWRREQDLNVHGWIYSLSDGLLTDLEVSLTAKTDVVACIRSATLNAYARYDLSCQNDETVVLKAV